MKAEQKKRAAQLLRAYANACDAHLYKWGDHKQDEKDAEELAELLDAEAETPSDPMVCVDVDGHIDEKGIRYLGKAYRQEDGTYRCMADVHGALCIVEVTLKKA